MWSIGCGHILPVLKVLVHNYELIHYVLILDRLFIVVFKGLKLKQTVSTSLCIVTGVHGHNRHPFFHI